MICRGVAVLCVIFAGLPASAQANEMLSFAEVRACATLALARHDLDPSRATQRARLTAERERITQEAAAIRNARAGVDRMRIGEVALFNDRIKRACADYATLVAAFEVLVNNENVAAGAFNATCADRDYDPVMADALPAPLRAAWHAAAEVQDPLPLVAMSELMPLLH
jgi:hypothetical protein